MKTFDAITILEIEKKYLEGQALSRTEKLWFHNMHGIRKAGIKYIYTNEELAEYAKCYNDSIYFAKKYCSKAIVLFDFQKEILCKIEKNRFNILLNSKQCGISHTLAVKFLHEMIFHGKSLLTLANKNCTATELISKIKELYNNLPFFLKQGVINWKQQSILFENGGRISISVRVSDSVAISFSVDIVCILDLGSISYDIAKKYYESILPTISSTPNSKIIISSQPDGKFFNKLLSDSELPTGHPEKNSYVTTKIYWWQIPGRDIEWKNNETKLIGGEDAFQLYYELIPKDKN